LFRNVSHEKNRLATDRLHATDLRRRRRRRRRRMRRRRRRFMLNFS